MFSNVHILLLVEITGNPNAVMHYVRFEEDIVLRYGIDLVGYTYEKLVNPSLLSTSILPLKGLLDALENGTCKFVKLSAQERKKRQDTYNLKLTSGEIEPRKRKRRSDAGVKRTRAKYAHVGGADSDGDESEDKDGDKIDGNAHLPKSSEFIDEAADDSA